MRWPYRFPALVASRLLVHSTFWEQLVVSQHWSAGVESIDTR